MELKTDYNILPSKITQEEALVLLETLRKDLRKLKSAKIRAILWAVDVHGITLEKIAKALGYKSRSQIHNIYTEAKGGDR